MCRKNIFTVSVCLSIWVTTFAQTKKSKIAGIMKTYHSYNMFDGAVLVTENGKIIYKGAFGKANREWDINNSVDTKFMIGSISKPITCFLTLLQAQKGLIDINKTIEDYLPEFKNKPAAKVTIKQLMSNTSGMPNYDIIEGFFTKYSRQSYTREEYVKVYMDSALVFEPGTKYFYSSWGFFTLGYILERVTGKSFAQLMKQDIFDMLQMTNTASYHHTQIVSKRAQGYDYAFGGFTSGDFRDQSNTMGAGDLYSTVEDMFKLHIGIQNNTLLNQQLTNEMFTPGMRPARYGYGWFNQNFRYTDTDSVAANYHLGMMEGFISFFLRIPETNSCAIILCNSSPTDFFGIAKSLVKVLYNKPVVVKQPMQKKIEKLIAEVGASSTLQAYQQLKADTANYYVDWISMNFLAEQLFNLKRYDDAKIISENNVLEFPNRGLVHYTMGNIYLALNRKQDAIISYNKALAIDPDYIEAKNKLKELTNQ
jgi:CubicO group peptidase (beta-lactamase class C family)